MMSERSGNTTTTTISIQIPSTAEEGDTLTFTVQGNTLEIRVPEGSEPGDVLEVQLAIAAAAAAGSSPSSSLPQQDCCKSPSSVVGVQANDNGAVAAATKDDTKTNVTLGNGVTLELFHCIPSGDEKQSNEKCSGNNDEGDAGAAAAAVAQSSPAHGNGKIEGSDVDDADDDGTHAHIWSAAMYCINEVFLSSSNNDATVLRSHVWSSGNKAPPTRILEMGSGTGVLGLAYALAAAVDDDDESNDSTEKAKTTTLIVLSDCDTVVPLLKHNVQCNKGRIPRNIRMECQALDWTQRESVAIGNQFDLIIGSDLLYNTATLKDLAESMGENLKDGGSILLSVRWRKPIAEREFFRKTASLGIKWSLLTAPCCDLNWQEFGNPHCEASNKYFRQQAIAVNGELCTLSEIDEEKMKHMLNREHEAFENCFLQVYLGKKDGRNIQPNKAAKRSHEAISEAAESG